MTSLPPLASTVLVVATLLAAAAVGPAMAGYRNCTAPVNAELCVRDGVCWWQQPYFCYLPDSTFLCLDDAQVRSGQWEQCEVCYDLRKCATPKCRGPCSKAFCRESSSLGWTCPARGAARKQATGNHSIMHSSKNGNTNVEVAAAAARAIVRDPVDGNHMCMRGLNAFVCGKAEFCASDDPHCLVNNTACSECCDYRGCSRYQSCAGVQCPASVCHAQSGGCWNYHVPYMCVANGGCAFDADYWPRRGCTDCCDFSTCYFKCTQCPPELCQAGTRCRSTAPYMCTSSRQGYAGKCEANQYAWGASPVCQACCSCGAQ